MRLVVCLPTYNERENVEPMVRRLGEVLAGHVGKATILVVDDASPDGTGEVAGRLAHELADVEVLRRPRKDGLGPAYLAAFEWALAVGADAIVQMDCDFSHDPNDVPRLLDALATADVVVGSRYARGGAVRDWGLARRSVSRFASIYARGILGVALSDLTSGFKCHRREVLEAIDLASIETRGYAFQIETTYRALRAGFRVTEIPIVFADRAAGRSKMTSRIALEAAVRVPELRIAAARGRLRPKRPGV